MSSSALPLASSFRWAGNAGPIALETPGHPLPAAAMVSVLVKAAFLQHSGLPLDGNGNEIREKFSNRPSSKSILPRCVTAVAVGRSDGRSWPTVPHSCAQFCHTTARQMVNEPLDELKLLKMLCLLEGRLSHGTAASCFPGSRLVLSSPVSPCWCHNPMPILFGVTAFPWSTPASECSPSASYFFNKNQFCIPTPQNPLHLSLT